MSESGRRSTWLVLGALIAGLLLGALSAQAGDAVREPLVKTAAVVGGLWLDALKMTVIPLIISLLITGIVSGADQARAGGIAGRSIMWFVIVLTASAAFGTLAMPVMLEAFPLPADAAEALRAGLASVDSSAASASVPTVEDWLRSLIPTNPIAAAANDKVLALVVFTGIFAFAVTRIDADGRQAVARLFKAVQDAMLVVVGWVLWLAPVGVLGLAFAVGAGAGGAAFGAVLHYVVLVSLIWNRRDDRGLCGRCAVRALAAWRFHPRDGAAAGGRHFDPVQPGLAAGDARCGQSPSPAATHR